MKELRIILALPFLAISLWATEPAASTLVLPEQLFPKLDEIIKASVQQSPRMISRALDLEIAENVRLQARSNLLPNVNATYGYNKSNDDSKYLYGPGNPNNSSNSYTVTKTPYSLILSQPLFYWGEKRNNYKVGQIQETISKGQYREGYRLLVQEIRASYLHLIVQKLAVRRNRYFLEYTNTRLKEQEDRFAKNFISGTEIASARLNAEQAQIAQEHTEFDFETAKQSFARLTGLASIADESIPDSIPTITYAPEPIAQLLAGYLAQKDPPTSEAFTLRHQIEIDRLNLATTKTGLRPKISAVMGLAQDEQNNFYGTGVKYSVTSKYAGLSMNWNIFDGLSSQSAVRISLATHRKLEMDYRQMTERLASDAQTLVKQLYFSARNMNLYDRFSSSSEANLKQVKEDFDRGVRSESEVGLAQLNLYDTQLSAGTSRKDFLLMTGDFLGMLVEDPALVNISNK